MILEGNGIQVTDVSIGSFVRLKVYCPNCQDEQLLRISQTDFSNFSEALQRVHHDLYTNPHFCEGCGVAFSLDRESWDQLVSFLDRRYNAPTESLRGILKEVLR